MPNLGDLVVRITGDISQFNASISEAEKRFSDTAGSIMKLGKNLTTYATLPILALGTASVKAAADIEMTQAAFETMLGNAEDAKNMIEDLRKMASKTPFQLSDLADASKILLQFGIESEKILPTLQQLGDVSLGNKEKLNSMAIAFGQIQSSGRLMGQDLLQLINAGFNPLKIISEKTGRSMKDLKKDMEAGAISSQMVADAFKTATSEGGQFFNGMEKASKTFAGQMSTLADDVTALGQSIGEILLPTLKDIVKFLSGVVQSFSMMSEENKRLVIQVGLLVAAIGPCIGVVLQLKKAFDFLLTHPVIAVIGGIAAGITAISIAANEAQENQKNLNAALLGTANYQITADAIAQVNKQLETLAEKRRIISGQGRETTDIDALIAKVKEERSILVNRLYSLKSNTDGQKALAAAIASTSANIEIVVPKIKQTGDAWKGITGHLTSVIEYTNWLNGYIEKNAETMVNWASVAESAMAIGQQAFGDVFSMMGQALVDNSLGWESWAKIAIKAVANIIKALGQQLTIMAIASFPDPVKMLAYGAGAVAAYVASGIVEGYANSFAKGTQFAPGGLSLVHKDELVQLPEGAQVFTKYQSDSMLANPTVGNPTNEMTHLVVQIDSRPILEKIFPATRNKTVLISGGAVV